MARREPDAGYRIGTLAERAGVSPRTIRYYEERGLLPASPRPRGGHRTYSDGTYDRLLELIRLRDLLGLSLEELAELAEAEGARAAFREQWEHVTDVATRLEILDAAQPVIERQLELVAAREVKVAELARELEEKLASLRARRDAAEKQISMRGRNR
jgi:MerR family transcriptional regulator, repressor of the yfmOP operon